MTAKFVAVVALLLSFVAFALSMQMNAFCTGNVCNQLGWSLLAFGWLNLAQDSASFSWLANPALAATWFLIATCLIFRPTPPLARAANLASCATLLVGASFLILRKVQVPFSGSIVAVTSYDTGYWFWLASMLLAVISAACLKSRE